MITCEICGKAFKPSVSFQKYCSKPCAKTAWLAQKRDRQKIYSAASKPDNFIRRVGINKRSDLQADKSISPKCAFCGERFIPSKHKAGVQLYCSRKCAVRGRYERRCTGHDSICLNCGKHFAPKSVERVKYCSRECAFEHRKAKPTPIIYKNCIHCGKQFIQEGQAGYCNDECRKATARKKSLERDIRNFAKVPFTCRQCGTEVVPKYNHKSKSRVFCSNKCSRKFTQKHNNTPKGFNDRARHKLRKIYGEKYTDHYQPINRNIVLERDDYVCYICGEPMMKEAKGGDVNLWPSVDHVIPLAKGGDHLYHNCRAAHLLCNSIKSDTT